MRNNLLGRDRIFLIDMPIDQPPWTYQTLQYIKSHHLWNVGIWEFDHRNKECVWTWISTCGWFLWSETTPELSAAPANIEMSIPFCRTMDYGLEWRTSFQRFWFGSKSSVRFRSIELAKFIFPMSLLSFLFSVIRCLLDIQNSKHQPHLTNTEMPDGELYRHVWRVFPQFS